MDLQHDPWRLGSLPSKAKVSILARLGFLRDPIIPAGKSAIEALKRRHGKARRAGENSVFAPIHNAGVGRPVIVEVLDKESGFVFD
jgi:hypothetical protein